MRAVLPFSKGEWRKFHDERGLWIAAPVADRLGVVCELGVTALLDDAEANADAISALPDLVNALLVLRLDPFLLSTLQIRDPQALAQIDAALAKAGVYLVEDWTE
jgi:hypothetical protein